MCLVVLVILVFLKSFRATIIPIVAIPISIIGTFTVAYFLGFTINILTLLALVLAIGLVVDDAIVVLENIFRHMEMGKPRLRAAFDGAKEIGFAVVATTVALVAVFIPVAFLTGTVGRLFREFGISVAVAVLISGFVALTLTPMLCSRILKPLHGGEPRAGPTRSFDAFFDWLDRDLRARPALRAAPRAGWCIAGGRAAGRRQRSGSSGCCRASWCPPRTAASPSASSSRPRARPSSTPTATCAQIEDRLLPLPERRGPVHRHRPRLRRPGPRDQRLRLPEPEAARRARALAAGDRGRSSSRSCLAIPGVLAFLINPPSLGGRFSLVGRRVRAAGRQLRGAAARRWAS